MKGCKYNCIVSSTVPENMTDQLNLIYSTSVSAFKDGERQWFHVFNREQCLTLKELLDFRKDGFIEIQNGQIALLMIKIIQKLVEMILSNVVHGNLTFDNVWIINQAGFWPPNQEHNYEIVFVKHQGKSSDHQRMFEILLTLNEIVWPKEKQRISDLFMGNKEKRIQNLFNLAIDLKAKVSEKTQTLTGYWSEISIHNKLKRFADQNIFTALLPLSETLGKSKFEQSLNWHYLDECRNIIIQYMLQSGIQQRIQSGIQQRIPTSIQQMLQSDIQTQLSNNPQSRKSQKEDLIGYLTANANLKIQDFIETSIREFEQIFKFKCNQSIKDQQQEYIELCLTSIQDHYFGFNSNLLEEQIPIVQTILERELLKTQEKIIQDHQKLFEEEIRQLINQLL